MLIGLLRINTLPNYTFFHQNKERRSFWSYRIHQVEHHSHSWSWWKGHQQSVQSWSLHGTVAHKEQDELSFRNTKIASQNRSQQFHKKTNHVVINKWSSLLYESSNCKCQILNRPLVTWAAKLRKPSQLRVEKQSKMPFHISEISSQPNKYETITSHSKPLSIL